MNLVQSFVEVVYFFHPVLWWLSNRIRVEREHCCDDLAMAVCDDRLSLAHALVRVAEFRAEPKLVVAFAANKRQLLSRVRRVLGVAEPSSRRFTGYLPMAVVLLSLSVGASVYAFQGKEGKEVKKNTSIQASNEELGVELSENESQDIDAVEQINVVSDTLIEIEAPEQYSDQPEIQRAIESAMAKQNSGQLDREMHEYLKLAQKNYIVVNNDTLQKKMAEYNAKMEALQKEMEPYQEQIQALQKEMEPLHQRIADLNLQVQKEHFAVERFQREEEKLDWKKEQLMETRQQLMEKRSATMYPKSGQAKVNATETEKQLADFETQIKAKEQEINALNDQIKQNRVQAKEAEKPMDNLNMEMEKINRETEVYTRKMDEIGKKMEVIGRKMEVEARQIEKFMPSHNDGWGTTTIRGKVSNSSNAGWGYQHQNNSWKRNHDHPVAIVPP